MKTEKQLKENNQMWEQKLLDNKREVNTSFLLHNHIPNR